MKNNTSDQNLGAFLFVTAIVLFFVLAIYLWLS